MVVRFVVTVFLGAVFWLWLAMPTCGCSTRVTAYHAAMRSDLKNLASQQEIYFSDQGSYSDDLQALSFTNTDGVLVDVVAFGSAGWTARARHVAWESERVQDFDEGGNDCVMYQGDVPRVPTTHVREEAPSAPLEVACDYRRRRSIRARIGDLLFGRL